MEVAVAYKHRARTRAVQPREDLEERALAAPALSRQNDEGSGRYLKGDVSQDRRALDVFEGKVPDSYRKACVFRGGITGRAQASCRSWAGVARRGILLEILLNAVFDSYRVYTPGNIEDLHDAPKIPKAPSHAGQGLPHARQRPGKVVAELYEREDPTHRKPALYGHITAVSERNDKGQDRTRAHPRGVQRKQ